MYFTKDEFIAFCYMQSKLNHLIYICVNNNNKSIKYIFLNILIKDLSFQEIKSQLSEIGFEITKDELEKYLKKFFEGKF